jgi:hypothetical protein
MQCQKRIVCVLYVCIFMYICIVYKHEIIGVSWLWLCNLRRDHTRPTLGIVCVLYVCMCIFVLCVNVKVSWLWLCNLRRFTLCAYLCIFILCVKVKYGWLIMVVHFQKTYLKNCLCVVFECVFVFIHFYIHMWMVGKLVWICRYICA